MKNTVRVVAALLWKNDRFLICQRPVNKARAHCWEFVGGKVERGETDAQALMRECMEEMALEISVGEVFLETLHEYDDIIVDLAVFQCVPLCEPQLLEHEDMRWITPSEADNFQFCPADEVVLEKLKNIK